MKLVLRRVLADVVWAVAIAAVALALLGSTRLQHRRPDPPEIDPAERERAMAELRSHVRDTLAADVHWLAAGATPDDLRQARTSLDFVLTERAGLKVDADLLDRLVALEAKTANGEAGRVSLDALADAVTRISIDRLQALTDEEIESAAAGFANVHAAGPQLKLDPEQRRDVEAGKKVDLDNLRYVPDPTAAWPADRVMLRHDGEGIMSSDTFVRKAKEIRARLGSTREAALAEQLAPKYVREALDERLDIMSAAFPDAKSAGLTPVQAFLLVYSLASDDRLARETLDLKLAVAAENAERADSARKDARTLTAYGRGGANFSTPLEMAFDRQRVETFLDRVERAAAR